jgi:formylglycine-generating enzyme required for sulfatase activity
LFLVNYYDLAQQINLINGDIFLMGSPKDEGGRSVSEIQHQVRVSDFYMAKYPVTVAQFEAYLQDSGTGIEGDKIGSNNKEKTAKQLPVVNVSWDDAVAYCKWLSEKLNKSFRLPTEAEWEYACRAGTTTPFNIGENLTTDQANYNGNYPYENYPKGKYIGKTTPVGKYPPNGWGLYDMHGNVREWCQDWYDEEYYIECKQQGIVDNPQGPKTGSFRVLRGGCWLNDAPLCRSADRRCFNPGYRDDSIGFRLVFVP